MNSVQQERVALDWLLMEDFEYEATESHLTVTLLRCVGTISRASLSTRPAPAGPECSR